MLAYGKNVLLSTSKDKIKRVYLNKGRKDESVLKYLKDNKINYVVVDNDRLNNMVKGNHQGIVLEVDEYKYKKLEDLYQYDFLVMLDHIEDPHNLGAIIRTCEAGGVKGIIIPKDRSASVNETVIKTSVGTTENVMIVKVTNLNETIKKLKKEDYFIYGTSMNGNDLRQVNPADRKVLIIGNEGKGMSNLTMKNCDEIIKIPMKGKVNSLNASVALGIVLFKLGGLS